MQRSNEPDAFANFERSGWNTAIGGYEQVFGPLTAQTIGPMLSAARVSNQTRVLDICTGHGVLAAAAAALGASVCALDFADEAVTTARRNVPSADIRQGDAQALPYPDRSFDAVICGYGLMHVPLPDRALAEMYRVTTEGGWAAASVWERPMPDNGVGLLFGAIKAHGRLDVGLPHGPDFFQFGDTDNMRAALAATGFSDVSAMRVDQIWRFRAPSELLDAILRGGVRVRALLQGQDAAALAAIQTATEQGMMRLFRDGDGYSVPMPAIVGMGMRR